MSKNDSLNHAIHNKEACEYLSKEPKFSDWVITTAFYSALHFIDYKIFPLDLKLPKYPVNFTDLVFGFTENQILVAVILAQYYLGFYPKTIMR